MNLVPSARFLEDLEKLEKGNKRLKDTVRKRLYQLQMNPNHPSLRLHKLTGTNVYSVSMTMSIRVVVYLRGDEAHLLRIGSHDDVY